MRASGILFLAAISPFGLPAHATAAGAVTQGRQLAAACAGCHLIERKATTEATGIPSITGLPAADIVARMLAYRSDDNSSQVMHVVSGALSKDEIAAIAQYLANTNLSGSP